MISNIVKQNHHTADVFRKLDIEYCCGGNWPLETVCENKGLAFENVKNELENSSRVVPLLPITNYENWSTDFLVSYIINIHHHFLYTSMPDTEAILKEFVEGHKKQFPEMVAVLNLFELLHRQVIPRIQYEESTIFPYILQIAHAHANKDSYASLLVKTLRKSLGATMKHEDQQLADIVVKIRNLTNAYAIPDKCCVSHRIALARLKDTDIDLLQHIYLENDILYPRALRIESDLLR